MKAITQKEQIESVESFLKYNPRVYFNGHLYLSILKNNFNEYKERKSESDKLYRSNDNKELFLNYYTLLNKMKQNEVIVIIFAPMFLDCLIWDYGKINGLSKTKLKEMKAYPKWEKVPELVNNKKIDSDALVLLHKLIRKETII